MTPAKDNDPSNQLRDEIINGKLVVKAKSGNLIWNVLFYTFVKIGFCKQAFHNTAYSVQLPYIAGLSL